MDDGREVLTEAPARRQDDLYDLLRRHDVTQFAYVPDAGHRVLMARALADPRVRAVALTTEEEGVALLAGADTRAVMIEGRAARPSKWSRSDSS
jgi:hypothetical protein